MALVDDFKALVASNEMLTIFVDNIEETDYGVKYLFDGLMQCAMAERDGMLIDIGDTNDDLVLQHIEERKHLEACRFADLDAWLAFVEEQMNV